MPRRHPAFAVILSAAKNLHFLPLRVNSAKELPLLTNLDTENKPAPRERNESLPFGKWYTRGIGVFFLLVAFSLFYDVATFGFRPEAFHKIFHVLLGFVIVWLGWDSLSWWKVFPWANGAFFLYVGIFGWVFPDFGGLDAFNRLDTVLHLLVGLSGLAVGFLEGHWQKGIQWSLNLRRPRA